MKKNEPNNPKPMRVLISGGGTGGHIFPALAIANAIRRERPDAEIKFVGALGRMEMERVPAAGYEIEGLPVAGFDRRRLWRNFAVVVKLLRSMRRARRIVREFRPDIAIGVGGYASGPTLKAAQRAGVPTLLQEQNSYAGVTNKLLARRARRICVAYAGMERFFPAEAIEMTGNPVRADIAQCPLTREEAKKKLGFDPARPLVLVVGGSLGARTINETIAACVDSIAASGAQMLWQTGKYYYDEISRAVTAPAGVTIAPFISDMATAYRAADIVVARAGAGTISELQILGLPSILVPSPNVAEDHQRKNAQALVDAGAAIMVLDAEAGEKLPQAILDLLGDPARRESLAANVSAMALPAADSRIARIVIEIVNQSRK